MSALRAALRLLARGVVLAAMALACERQPGGAPQLVRSPTPLDTATAGTISGTVRFTGAVPPPEPVAIGRDPTCAALYPRGLVIDEIAVAGGKLADVFVAITSGLGARVYAVPAEPVVIDQRGCRYLPRVAGVQAGQPVEFVNSDDTLHNVHGMPARSAPWNFAMAFQGARRRVALAVPEPMVEIRCEVHPWMRAYLGVVDHPYHAVTGASGTFTLAAVPPGTYVLAARHPRLGTQERTVTLPPNGSATADFTFAQ